MTHGLRRDATALMVMYARYHRDRRNIATHFVGVPMIVFAVQVLFFESDEVCETSYRDRGGKYQGQTGVTLPKT